VLAVAIADTFVAALILSTFGLTVELILPLMIGILVSTVSASLVLPFAVRIRKLLYRQNDDF
jgi:hypothetical protein